VEGYRLATDMDAGVEGRERDGRSAGSNSPTEYPTGDRRPVQNLFKEGRLPSWGRRRVGEEDGTGRGGKSEDAELLLW
jgi:hypothetical protein